jgi:hypothetical protein
MREIIEVLHEQLAVLRDQLAGARAREEFFQMLLTTDGTLDRESRLLALLEANRREESGHQHEATADKENGHPCERPWSHTGRPIHDDGQEDQKRRDRHSKVLRR